MVKALIFMALLVGHAAHATSLTAQLDRTTVALGEPVTLNIQASGLDLDALDLTPLEAGFEVFGRSRSRGTDSDTLVLTLYPRSAGSLSIPPLQLDTRRTVALSLSISDGSDAVPRVTAYWEMEPAAGQLNQGRVLAGSLQVNQPARLSLAICDDGSLQWRRPALPTHAGRMVRVLGEDEGRGERAGEGCTLRRFHWALLATREGVASLTVPMLDASRFGQRLRFPGPSLNFEATALPAWLPAHVPPVAPVVQADALPARWPLQRPLGWRWVVEGGYSADGLKALLELQLRESPALAVYPPLIEAVAPDDLNSPLSRYAVTLFLQPRASGDITLPTLNLPWYDAARGQVAGVALAGPTLTVFDPRWQRARWAAGGAAGLLLLAALAWHIRRMARWRLARRRGLRAIRQAKDITELAHAVRRFSLAGRSPAPSLGEWQRRLVQDATGWQVADAVHQLEQQAFGVASPDLPALKLSFCHGLSRVRPRSRFLDIRPSGLMDAGRAP